MDVTFCVEALQEAIARYGTPQIFNSDQGSQFTSNGFTACLKALECRSVWMDEDDALTTFSLNSCGVRLSVS